MFKISEEAYPPGVGSAEFERTVKSFSNGKIRVGLLADSFFALILNREN